MKFIHRMIIGYTIIWVIVVGFLAFILSGASERVMNYVVDVIEDLERSV